MFDAYKLNLYVKICQECKEIVNADIFISCSQLVNSIKSGMLLQNIKFYLYLNFKNFIIDIYPQTHEVYYCHFLQTVSCI